MAAAPLPEPAAEPELEAAAAAEPEAAAAATEPEVDGEAAEVVLALLDTRWRHRELLATEAGASPAAACGAAAHELSAELLDKIDRYAAQRSAVLRS